MRLAIGLLVPVILILASACGGNGSPAAVGTISAAQPTAYVNTGSANSGDRVRRGDRVGAGGGGRAIFRLKDDIDVCMVINAGEARVWPTGSIIVRFEFGRVWCRTSDASNTKSFDTLDGDIEITAADPVFGVDVSEDGKSALIRVAIGEIEVRSVSASDGPVLVRAGQQIVVVRGENPGTPQEFRFEDLDPDEQQAVLELGTDVVPTVTQGPDTVAPGVTITTELQQQRSLFTLSNGQIDEFDLAESIEIFDNQTSGVIALRSDVELEDGRILISSIVLEELLEVDPFLVRGEFVAVNAENRYLIDIFFTDQQTLFRIYESLAKIQFAVASE